MVQHICYDNKKYERMKDMLYYEFNCNLPKKIKKNWLQKGFIKNDNSIDCEKVNNYLTLVLNIDNDVSFRFYDLENGILKGVLKIDFKKICIDKPENILKFALVNLFDTLNLNIIIKETTLKNFLYKSQWSESLLGIRSPKTGEIVKVSNSYLSEFFDCEVAEKLIKIVNFTKDEILKQASKLFVRFDFINEIQRIYDTKNLKYFYGHPIHYVINDESSQRCKNIVKLLTETLYAKGRIKSRRITIIDDYNLDDFIYDKMNFEELLEDNEGGTVLINFDKNIEKIQLAHTTDFWNIINKYSDKVLFIFVDLPHNMLYNSKNGIKLIMLSDGFISGRDAKIYIKNIISSFDDFEGCANPFDYDTILDEEIYRVTKIDDMIDLWKKDRLKKEIFELYA